MRAITPSAADIPAEAAPRGVGQSPSRQPAAPATRLHALDALRGGLATVVVAHHALLFAGCHGLSVAADLAVLTFFAISGYVLALSYDGRPLGFLLRRLVRLWPVYAVCIVAGYALVGRLPPPAELAWWPMLPFDRATLVDLPAWTLYIEVWMSPVMLAMFWLAARGRACALALTILYFCLVAVDVRLFPIGFIGIGVAASRFAPRLPERVPAWALSLGRMSYSLYLSHWVVLHACTLVFGEIGALIGLPPVFAVAWLLWRTVERPSIRWSRIVGSLPLEQLWQPEAAAPAARRRLSMLRAALR
jgi:peptidoglycan/LPS O-acetylase OafA/YrhL